ncbi:Lanosterol 14-alpha-demethylase, partial [Ascosphaera pollenicola]
MNQRSSGSGFKNMWSSLTGHKGDDLEAEKEKELAKTLTFQDKLVNSLIEQVIDPGSPDSLSDGKTRPQDAGPLGNGLSLPVMTDNFRRFNGRIGVVFTFQHDVEKLLQWQNPTHTLAFLATFTLICLHPTLLVSLPLIVFLLFIMVPGYLTRHPPPPVTSTSSTTAYYSYDGPALAPAQTVKPASETSRDFFDNLAHLQRSMGDFSDAYDAVVAALLPAANFSNERLSSTIFLLVTMAVIWLLLTAHLVPWNLVVMVVGDLGILAGSERVRWHVERVLQNIQNHSDSKGHDDDGTEKYGKTGSDARAGAGAIAEEETPGSKFLDSLKSTIAITLSTSPEVREVEIFELQHKVTASYSSNPVWETFIFTPTPYDPLCPARIAGDRPQGCRFFEDVQPPEGWTWKGHKWELDLDAKEWVLERMVTGVGVEG